MFSEPRAIVLTSGELQIKRDVNFQIGRVYGVTVAGPGRDLLSIDGNGQGRVFYTEDGLRFTLSGVTVKNGVAVRGGGIYARGTLELFNALVTGNRAAGFTAESGQAPEGAGGGIFASFLEMRDCIVSHNTASGVVSLFSNGRAGSDGTGGGMYVSSPSSVVVSSQFVNNTARGMDSPELASGTHIAFNGGWARGGGIFSPTSLTIVNSSFEGNSAIAGGGAPIGSFSGVGGNGGSAMGGAIDSSGSRILNSTFEGNSAVAGSGRTPGSADSAGEGGSAFGGAIADRNVQAANITIVNNVTRGGDGRTGGDGRGGGSHHGTGTWNLANATITNNFAVAGVRIGTSVGGRGQGGGLWTAESGNFLSRMRNTVISANTALTGSDVYGELRNATNNFVSRSDGSTGIVNGENGNIAGTLATPADPMLGPLTFNGGVTSTRAPLSDSPLINAGNNEVFNPIFVAGANGPLVFDQRGFQRITPTGGTIDIGSVEFGSEGVLQPGRPDLIEADDIGASRTDNITATPTATFDIGNIIPGARVQLLRNGVQVAAIPTSRFGVSLTDLNPPRDATVLYTVRQVLGNYVSAEGPPLTVTYDHTAPVITVAQAAIQSDPTTASTIYFNVTANEPIDFFGAPSVSLAGSTADVAAATINVSRINGSTSNYLVSVDSVFGDSETVVVSIRPGVVRDYAGNASTGSIAADNSVTLDNLATVSGRVTTPFGAALRGATVRILCSNGSRRTATTSSFGVFTLNDVAIGGTCNITVLSKRYRFTPRSVPLTNDVSGIELVGLE
jgi:hypothetical protein